MKTTAFLPIPYHERWLRFPMLQRGIRRKSVLFRQIPDKRVSIHRALRKVQKIENSINPFNYACLILYARFPLRLLICFKPYYT